MHVWFKKLKKKYRPGSHLPILKVWITLLMPKRLLQLKRVLKQHYGFHSVTNYQEKENFRSIN